MQDAQYGKEEDQIGVLRLVQNGCFNGYFPLHEVVNPTLCNTCSLCNHFGPLRAYMYMHVYTCIHVYIYYIYMYACTMHMCVNTIHCSVFFM